MHYSSPQPSNFVNNGKGFVVNKLDFDALFDVSSPIFALDHFLMSEPTFPPHPHAGFSAVTYVLPSSNNSILNRDSHGHEAIVRPGDLAWTLAGRGVKHEEVPLQRGVNVEGIQLFVKLSPENESMPAEGFAVKREQMPIVNVQNSIIRVLTGTYRDTSSALSLPEPFNYLHITSQKEDTLSIPLSAQSGGLVYVLEGQATLNPQMALEDTKDRSTLEKNGVQAFNAKEDTALELRLSAGAQVLVLHGQHHGLPLYSSGPFAMYSKQRLTEAKAANAVGKMGNLLPYQ
ncbi:MAG: pirin family protein, partial [Pseudomonadota bacterium]